MNKFISCDWGTTALRLRVIDNEKMQVLSETVSSEGISVVFNKWRQNESGEDKRLSFYQSVLAGQISKLEEQLNLSLQQMPLIISGMASSSIGMMELPYKEAPFNMNGKDLNMEVIEATESFKHTILMISGVKTNNDIMRGEETQLIGCFNENEIREQIFILPGTHSKHVWTKQAKMTNLKTYMTGEFFELLATKSILSDNVEKTSDILSGNNLKSFERGIKDSRHSDILHDSFLVRTNHLFGRISRQENYSYLSGLLIGTELKELINSNTPINIVGDQFLSELYSSAFKKLGIVNFKCQDAGKAILKAHSKLYNLYKSKLNTELHYKR